MTELKTGKRLFVADDRDFKMADFVDVQADADRSEHVGRRLEVVDVAYAMSMFNQGKAWTLPAHNPEPHPNEGHYVPLVAKRSGYLKVVTWGKLQRMSVPFWSFYADESWAIYSKDLLSAQGRSPEGLDVKALDAQLTALK